MEKIQKLVETTKAKFPHTAIISDFMHGSNDFEIRTYEHKRKNAKYEVGIVLWDLRKGCKPRSPLLSVNGSGTKSVAYEMAYTCIYQFLVDTYEWTQGNPGYDELLAAFQEKFPTFKKVEKDTLEVEVLQNKSDEVVQMDINAKIEEGEGEKIENVIIVNPKDDITVVDDTSCYTLTDFCSTEKIFDFTEGESALMNRWFLMSSERLSTNSTGLLKYWHITRDLLMANKSSINLLPIKGFVFGRYDLEFRVMAPANPFIAGLICMSAYPYDYGVSSNFYHMNGVYVIDPNPSKITARNNYNLSTFTKQYETRNSSYVAVTRPNVKLDLNKGGELVLKFPFKYHKTFVRNFDHSFDKAINEGILGANFGRVDLNVLSQLMTGVGQPNYVDIRVMFRIVKSQLAGMTAPDIEYQINESSKIKMNKIYDYKKFVTDTRTYNNRADRYRKDMTEESRKQVDEAMKALDQTQGPILTTLGAIKTGVDVAKDVIDLTEQTAKRVGFRTVNRDKPVEYLSVVKTVPRPRQDFNFGIGLDDAIKLCVSPQELTNFFEKFDLEPKNFREFAQIPGFLASFNWKTNQTSGQELFRWPVDLQVSHTCEPTNLETNLLKSPVAIASSMFVNFWGTLQVQFQIIKTTFHRGTLEVGIHFGREVDNEQLKSCYLKVCDIQENNGFVVTVPYIYDTVARHLTNTTMAGTAPVTNNPSTYKFYTKASLVVRVVNTLQAPTTVYDSVNIIVWIKAGDDFSMNGLIPCNTTFYDNLTGEADMTNQPADLRKVLYSDAKHNTFMLKSLSVSGEKKNSIVKVDGGMVLNKEYVQTDFSDEENKESVQMEDFSTGVFRPNVVSSVDHLDFKNILKMPVKVLRRVVYRPTIKTDSAFEEVQNFHSIPVAPLNFSLLKYFASNKFLQSELQSVQQNDFLVVQNSPQYQIMRMFGMFRGSVNLTFIFNVAANAPIYISYLPHDYSLRPFQAGYAPNLQIINKAGGNVPFPNFGLGLHDSGKMDPSVVGMNTTFVVPIVNPTEHVQIPMTNPNNWLLLNRDYVNVHAQHAHWGFQSTMREILEWFNGHVVLWSMGEFTYDMFISCGDDIELGAFIGHPGVINAYAATALTDDFRCVMYDEVQSDFNTQDFKPLEWVVTRIPSSVKVQLAPIIKKIKEMNIVDIVLILGSIIDSPIKTGMLALTILVKAEPWLRLTSGVDDFMSTKAEKIMTITDKVSEIAEGPVPDAINRFGNFCVEDSGIQSKMIFDTVVSLFPSIKDIPGVASKIWNISKEIVHAIIVRDWRVTAFSIFNILVEIGVVSIDSMSLVVERIVEYLKFSCRHSVQAAYDDIWKLGMSVIEVLITAISFMFKMNYSQQSLKVLCYEMIVWGDKFPSQMNSILAMVKRVLQAVKIIFDYFCARAVPEVDILQAFVGKDVELTDFIIQSQKFTMNFNKSDIKLRANRIKFLALIFRAAKLKTLLVRHSDTIKALPLINVCNEVLKKANEYQYLFQNDVVKKEPFVLCMVGKPKVGKSFLATRMATEALSSIGITPSTVDYVYTVSPGVEYWNGYENQEVVVFDDWCNLKDEQTLTKHISYLYALKTSQPFNVPRAEIENKEQVANPHLVILSTNDAFPISPNFSSPEAIYRRRDMLVEVVLDGYSSISEVPQDTLEKFEHLKFLVSQSVTRQDCMKTEMNYEEFIDFYRQQVLNHHLEELKNMQTRYNWLMQNVKDNRLDCLEISNPFEVIRQANNVLLQNNPQLISDKLELEVEKIMQIIDNYVSITDDELTISRQGTQMFGEEFYYKVQNWIMDSFADLKSAIKEVMGDPHCRIKCDVCGSRHTERSIHRRCEQGHFICWACVDSSVDESDISRTLHCYCPIDKSRMGNFLSFESQAFITLLKKNGRAYIKSWMKEFKKDPMGNFFLYLLVGQVAYLFADFFGNLIYPTPMNKYYINYTQVNWEIPEIDCFGPLAEDHLKEYFDHYKTPEEVVTCYEQNTLCSINFKDIKRIFCAASELKSGQMEFKCIHSLLRLSSCIFRDGHFIVSFMGKRFVIDSVPCAKRDPTKVECEMHDLEMLSFLKNNVVQETGNLRQCYLNCEFNVIAQYYPKFMWPPLIYTDIDKFNIKDLVKNNWWEYLKTSSLTSYIKRVMPWLIAAGAIYATGVVGREVVNMIMKLLSLGELVESKHSYERKANWRKTVSRRKPRTQSTEFLDNKINVVLANYVVIECGKHRFLGLGIKGSLILLPKHMKIVLDRINNFEVDFFGTKHSKTRFLFQNCKTRDIPAKDLFILDLGLNKYFKNIIGYFKNNEVGKNGVSSQLTFFDGMVDGKVIDEIAVTLRGQLQSNTAFSAYDKQEYISMDCIRYDYERSGACCSVVTDESNNPIVAVHISGSHNDGEGSGVRVYQEDLNQDCIQSFFEEDIVEYVDTSATNTYYGDDCNFEYIATLKKEVVPFLPSKTKLVASKIDQFYDKPSTVKPAYLSSHDKGYSWEKSPLYYGVIKNGKPSLDFPIKVMMQAFTVLSSYILDGADKEILRTPEKMQAKQAIIGIPDIEVNDPYIDEEEDELYYGPIPIKTSAGWPYTCLANKYGVVGSSKEGWLEFLVDEQQQAIDVKIHPFLVEQLNKNAERRKKGQMAINVFQDCLKDEKRKIAKVESKGGTRLFSMGNVECTIALRQFTLDFTSFIRYNRLKNGISIGINPESIEWTNLAHRLLEVSDNIFTTDFSNFGAGLNSGVVDLFPDLVIKYYEKFGKPLSGDEQLELRVLIRELTNSYHVVGNLIYQTCSGSPSGAAITAEVNSFVHLMYVFMVWKIISDTMFMLITNESVDTLAYDYLELKSYLKRNFDKGEMRKFIGKMSLNDMIQNVFVCVYGDDGIFSVSDEYKEVFNAVTINLVLKEHNIGVTDASKNALIKPYTPLGEAIFLKRKFRKHPYLDHLYTAQIEWDSIENCTRWVHNNLDIIHATYDNCDTALDLSFGHGPEVFDEFREMINEKLSKAGISKIHKTWEDVHRRVFPDVVVGGSKEELNVVKNRELHKTNKNRAIARIDLKKGLKRDSSGRGG